MVTLKQFRDARHPGESCYQALVRSRLSVDRYNRGGPLGLYNLLQGDVSGGFRIRLHDDPALPIAASLGLEAVRERTAGGRTVSVLEPVFPFWTSVDLTYGRGENLGWRMLGSPWFKNGNEIAATNAAAPSYNTVAGAAQQEWISPFVVPKASCDVFPLPVHDRDRLTGFIDEYLNRGEPDRFEPWGTHVYMVASRSRIFSQARSAAVCEIAFFVPLLWYVMDRLKGVAVAKPFAFVDDPVFAMTLREVQGIPAVDATIETPVRSWLRQGPVLRMKADVFTVLDAGMGSQRRTLLEVLSGGPPAPAQGPPAFSDPAGAGPDGLLDLIRSLLSGRAPMQVVTLKQFRDAEHPARACYQALVLEPWRLLRKRAKPPERLGCGMRVRVCRYPSLPLARMLGLVDPLRPPRKRGLVTADVLTPEDPFRVELDIDMGLAEVLSRSAGTLPWTMPQERVLPTSEDLGKLASSPVHERQQLERLKSGGPQAAIRAFLDNPGDCWP